MNEQVCSLHTDRSDVDTHSGQRRIISPEFPAPSCHSSSACNRQENKNADARRGHLLVIRKVWVLHFDNFFPLDRQVDYPNSVDKRIMIQERPAQKDQNGAVIGVLHHCWPWSPVSEAGLLALPLGVTWLPLPGPGCAHLVQLIGLLCPVTARGRASHSFQVKARGGSSGPCKSELREPVSSSLARPAASVTDQGLMSKKNDGPVSLKCNTKSYTKC